MKAVRFILWDFWVKVVLWSVLWVVLIPFKIIQYGVRFDTGDQRRASKELVAIERERLALEKQRLEQDTRDNRAE